MNWIAFSLVCSLLLSWSDHLFAADPTPEQVAFFESKVRPILVERCFSCHSSSAKKIKGGLTLDSREAALRGGELGAAFVPGKPNESRLIKAVKFQELEMPPTGRIPAAEVAILSTWIEMGAPWPAKPLPKPASQQPASLAESHWAWQPLSNVVPPVVKNQLWTTNSIDRFILNGLESRKLSPAPQADARTLIRRAYLDLVGLPAPPDEVEAFVQDPWPNAYEQLIDRLLASPDYGERWGRYWLDVARYSDGHGGFLDAAPLPDAWRYRDWVVQAFNDDLPYDSFIQQQIAGDRLGTSGSTIATGFLAVGPTYTDDGGDPESIAKTRAETLDDRVDTVTRAFLGLTVSCARCHDHKFDPIPQADYYSLAGVFNNTKNMHASLAPESQTKQFESHARAVKAIEDRLKLLPRGIDDANRQTRQVLEADLKQLKAKAPPPLPRFHSVADAGATDMPIAIRGDLRKPGAIVPRRFLTILSKETRPTWSDGSGRLQLAEAIASAKNPLTSRVIVNRVWQHHFGQPLVRTPSNFGLLGEKPTHPELLDWLSGQLVSSGWSLKSLHRTILLSTTYRMSSRFDEANFRIDGENRHVWRMNARRLDVEAWRDSLFTVTGELERTRGGAPVSDILASPRRTLYAAVSRNGDRLPSDTFLRLFDFPSARATVEARPVSTVPQQYLFLLNSPFMAVRAKAFADRLANEFSDDIGRIDRAYRLLYARPPAAEEQELGLAFLSADPSERRTRWLRYAQVLLSSHEFMQIR